MSEVYVGDSESIDSALKRFNKRVMTDGVLKDARQHQYYEKPSELRNRKKAAAVRKRLKALRKREERRAMGR